MAGALPELQPGHCPEHPRGALRCFPVLSSVHRKVPVSPGDGASTVGQGIERATWCAAVRELAGFAP